MAAMTRAGHSPGRQPTMIQPDRVRFALPIQRKRRPATIALCTRRLKRDGRLECLPAVAGPRNPHLGCFAAGRPEDGELRIAGTSCGGKRHARRKLSTEPRFTRQGVHLRRRRERLPCVTADRDKDITLASCCGPPHDGDE
jgi:hypothetical protein